ncbi:Perphorin-2, partial [Tetrabaena socialis]
YRELHLSTKTHLACAAPYQGELLITAGVPTQYLPAAAGSRWRRDRVNNIGQLVRDIASSLVRKHRNRGCSLRPAGSMGRLSLAVVALCALAAMPAAFAGPFPYCRCIPKGPFEIIRYVDRLDGAFCFEVNKVGCSACGACAGMDLRKVEWNVDPVCRGTTTVTATVNGLAPMQQAFFTAPSDTPAGKAVLKLSGLKLNNTAASGTIICLQLEGKCDSLEKLCVAPKGQPKGICSTAMFNTKDTCCPQSQTGWDFPSPPPPPSPRPSPPPRPVAAPPPPPRPSPPPSPPVSCPVCISINSSTSGYPLTREICDNMAAYVNANWASSVPLTTDFTCTSATPEKVTVCGEAATAAATTAISVIAENTFEIQRLLESLRLSCAFPALGGYFLVVLVDYGTCRALFSFTQDCTQPGTNGFPFCQCNRRPRATPFALEPTIKIRPGANTKSAQYCFTVATVAPYDPTSGCGKSDTLFKAEWFVKNNTRGAVTGVTAAGVSTSWVFDSDAKVFRISNLNWSTAFVSSSKPELCVQLTGITIADFCQDANCAYALFNPNKDCCPMGTSTL